MSKSKYNTLSESGREQLDSFVSNSVSYGVNNFWKFFAFMSMILLGVAYLRISNNQEPISLLNVLDFISNHFDTIADMFNAIKIPTIDTSAPVALIFEGAVSVWNNLVVFLNVLGYLLSVVFKVVYTAFSVLIWVISGYII